MKLLSLILKDLLKKLTPQSQKRINQVLLQIEIDLKSSSLGIKKFKGTDSIWEARTSKSLRITFNSKREYNYP